MNRFIIIEDSDYWRQKMVRVALISFSDGRSRVHENLSHYIYKCEKSIAEKLEGSGEVKIINGSLIVNSNENAKKIALELRNQQPDVCILNIPVFAFPNYAAIAAKMLRIPLLAIAPQNGNYPGLGGLQAAVNYIRQIGMKCEKVWGNIESDDVLQKVMNFVRAGHAITQLQGQVYGLIGGRSIGMGSGAADQDRWMRVFGVDVDHVDQLEILRLAEEVNNEDAEKAVNWLEKYTNKVEYDGEKLSHDTLVEQIKHYIATKKIIRDRGYAFVGVKCHYELSEHYCTQCISAAFCNDPYDWEGKKEPMVFSCEADSDAALTMQVLKLISGKPALFMDFRHYDEKDKVFALCNCGACATWYAGQSDNPIDNLRKVTLSPVISKYNGVGCHVKYVAKEGPMTFARLCRDTENYKMQVFYGEFNEYPEEKMKETCDVWPHGYASIDNDPYDLINRYESNHIHAVSGNYIKELKIFCKLAGIEFDLL